MAYDDDPHKVSVVPFSLTQNPAPNPVSGQEALSDRDQLVQAIMETFRKVLPSNYVAVTNGPWYSLQFQAMAEQLADIQLEINEVFKDSDWDFTRSDFLWQVLGAFVFPGATDQSGIPVIKGDVAYRTFLQKMVLLLLEGATKKSMEGGLECLDPQVTAWVLERYLETPPRDPNGAYTLEDQFIVDIFIEASNNFPVDTFTLQRNSALVLSALKPAHVFYNYSHLFRDAFGTLATDNLFKLDLFSYYYGDFRKWCLGAERIAGAGDTLTNRTLFSDPSVSFSSIRVGATLTILSGTNAGMYKVKGTRALLYGAEATPRAYTTSTGGSGTLTAVSADVVSDPTQDWGTFAPDTTITITTGPNAGTYRLDAVLGPEGGVIGTAAPLAGPVKGTQVRLAPSIIQLDRLMPAAATSQSYEVVVDRLGVQVPHTILDEDVTVQFLL